MGKIVGIMLALIILLVPVLGCSAPEASPDPGKTAPDFRLEDMNGNEVILSDFRGRAVLLNFWTTWCPACVAEMPYLQQAYDRLSPKGVTVLAVDIAENPETVRKFLTSHNYTLPVLLDRDSAVSQEYRITGLPTSFIIDAEGTVRYVKIGAFASFAEIESKAAGFYPAQGVTPK